MGGEGDGGRAVVVVGRGHGDSFRCPIKRDSSVRYWALTVHPGQEQGGFPLLWPKSPKTAPVKILLPLAPTSTADKEVQNIPQDKEGGGGVCVCVRGVCVEGGRERKRERERERERWREREVEGERGGGLKELATHAGAHSLCTLTLHNWKYHSRAAYRQLD